MAANDPSGPIMFLEEVIAEALGLQRTVEKLDCNGNYWLSGGCTPQTAGAKLDLREVAEAVFDALPTIREPVIAKAEGRR